jgi:hypothetical protein
MAESQKGIDVTMIAEWDLRTFQYAPVIIGTGDQKVIVSSQVGDGPLVGVLQNKPQSGHAATVRVSGVSKFKAGLTIVRGVKIKGGAGVQSVITGNSGHMIGIALESAASGSNFQGVVTPGQYAPLA